MENKLKNIIPGEQFAKDNFYQSGVKKTIYFSHIDMSGLDDMYNYSKQIKFYEHMGEMSPHKSVNDTVEYIEVLLNRIKNGYKNGSSMYWFIRLLKTNKVIGSIGMMGINIDRNEAEIGYGLSPKYWGSGIIFESLWIMLNYSFEILHLNSITALSHKDNLRSINVLKTVGFKHLDHGKNDNNTITLMINKKNAKLERALAFAKLINQNWEL